MILAICLAFAVAALPNVLSEKTRAALPEWMPSRTINLGLDLQGGSYLLLEVDFDAYLREQTNNLADEIRTRLRAKKIGYRGLAATGSKVAFSLRDEAMKQDMLPILREGGTDVELNDMGSGSYEARYSERWKQDARRQIVEQSLEIVTRRVDETGTREPIIQRQGDNRILLQVPGLDNPEHLKSLLGRTAKMTFHLVDPSMNYADIERGVTPPGTRIVSGDEKEGAGKSGPHKYAIFSRVMLSGDMLVDAHPTYDNQSGEPVVAFRFNAAGARKFGEITSQNVGKPFAILLDNKVITAPRINSPILGGSGIITGSFTTESANDLALLLRAGALPAPLKIIEERSVGPSLGSDSIEAGKKAALLGIAFVVMFMIVCYGLFGLFADIAMVVNALIVLALMSMLQATLTLPGIAGIVLTMGMAVDTNVLIYERMREEMRAGKSAYAAVESGFRMAFGTIIDSHITTLSAALILYYFGTGTVKGFGVTLSIGIIASLFTAVLVTRLMVVTWLHRAKPKTLPI